MTDTSTPDNPEISLVEVQSKDIMVISVRSPVNNGLEIKYFIVEVYTDGEMSSEKFAIADLIEIINTPLTYTIEINSLTVATYYSFKIKVRGGGG